MRCGIRCPYCQSVCKHDPVRHPLARPLLGQAGAGGYKRGRQRALHHCSLFADKGHLWVVVAGRPRIAIPFPTTWGYECRASTEDWKHAQAVLV